MGEPSPREQGKEGGSFSCGCLSSRSRWRSHQPPLRRTLFSDVPDAFDGRGRASLVLLRQSRF